MMENFNKQEIKVPQVITETSKFDPDKRLEINSDTGALKDEVEDSRTYGIEKASDVAKDMFSQDVLQEWKNMSEHHRKTYLENYGDKIAEVLGINFKGIVFTERCDHMFCWGYTDGSGKVYVTPTLYKDPSNVIEAINTISHEIRHEFQIQAIRNPGKFHVDEKSYNEWKVAKETYSLIGASKLDPFGYEYNPLELDARHFGERIIRNLQRNLMKGVG